MKMEKSKKQSKINKSNSVQIAPSNKSPEEMKKEIAAFLAKQKIPKVAIFSEAPFIKSSSGILGNYFSQGFLSMGIPAIVIANYGVEPGGYLRFGQTNVLPVIKTDDDKKGLGTALQHFAKFQLDVFFYVDKDFIAGSNIATKVPNTWVLARLDSTQYPQEAIDALKKYKIVIAPTKFAEKELNRYGIKNEYIPIGVNTKIFQQTPKIESRKYFMVPKDHFCIGIVGDNKDKEPSNGWDSMFEAIQIFFKICPEARAKTTILIHSNRKDKEGIDLEKLTKGFGIDQNCVCQDPHLMILGLPEGAMSRMYSSMDVLLHLSRRSGSGMTILEAGACGVPAIVTDFGAQKERVNYGKCGWLIPAVHLVPNEDKTQSAIPDAQKAGEALAVAYHDKKKRNDLSKKAKAYALNYSWEVILEQKWLPFLQKKGEEILGKDEVKIVEGNTVVKPEITKESPDSKSTKE
jgi:glycosyltransferase involved in cell wall biosynthesis